MIILRVALLALATLVIQQFPPAPQAPTPQEQGEDDPTPEPNRPLSCNNYFSTPAPQKCKCGRALHEDCSQPIPDVEMDHRCSTYCRKQNCKCVSKCTS